MKHLGLDLDNTIVCYDRLFHRLALECGWIPAELPATKRAVRDHLRAADREDDWTLLQGLAYGDRMTDAEPFPGVHAALARLRAAGWRLSIVSHRTLAPYRGPTTDLHAAARHWLDHQAIAGTGGRAPIDASAVWLETTRQAKADRIARLGCTHFLDDLPEFLTAPGFPAGVTRLLFDPSRTLTDCAPLVNVGAWKELGEALEEEEGEKTNHGGTERRRGSTERFAGVTGRREVLDVQGSGESRCGWGGEGDLRSPSEAAHGQCNMTIEPEPDPPPIPDYRVASRKLPRSSTLRATLRRSVPP